MTEETQPRQMDIVATVFGMLMLLIGGVPAHGACKPMVAFFSGASAESKNMQLWRLCQNNRPRYEEDGIAVRCYTYADEDDAVREVKELALYYRE